MGERIQGCTLYNQEFEGAGGISLIAQWEVSYSAWLTRSGRQHSTYDDLQLEGQPTLLGHSVRIGPVTRDLGLPPPIEIPHWHVAFARCCRGPFEQEVLETCEKHLRSRLFLSHPYEGGAGGD